MSLLPAHRKNFGLSNETLALKYLRRQGLQLITRNYQCRAGEIDLIVSEGETIVFVEVRFRGNRQFGSPIESVTRAKQTKIIRCARHFLLNNPQLATGNFRFDIIGISNSSSSRNRRGYEIEWLPNAFTGSW